MVLAGLCKSDAIKLTVRIASSDVAIRHVKETESRLLPRITVVAVLGEHSDPSSSLTPTVHTDLCRVPKTCHQLTKLTHFTEQSP